MAEGGHFSRTIEGGSDIVYEFVCTPCAADGSRLEALQFCQTCNQFLCNTCTKYHQRLSKSHQLIPAGSTKQSNPQTHSKNILVATKCHFHPDRNIEMYCGTHDMVYCSLCIAKEHRSCTNVEEIEDNTHKLNQPRLQQIVVNVGRVNKELLDLKQEKSSDLKRIKTKKTGLLNEIDVLRKEMNHHLDKLESTINAELDAEISKLEQEIQDDISTTDDLLTTTSEMKSDLENNKDDKHMFIAEKIGQKVVSDANAFLVKANSSKHPMLKFERNKRLYDDIKMAESMGRIARSRTSPQHSKRSKYVVKSNNYSYVKIDTDKMNCSGICQLQDGTILISDLNNSQLMRLDDQLNVKEFCALKSRPGGICSISPTEVAVRYKESIQYVHVGQSLSPGKTINVTRLNICNGNDIAFCADNLWTFGEKCILVYSTSGDLVKKIDTDSHGQKIFPTYNPSSIAVSDHGSKVYVTANEDRVVVFNNNGDVINVLRDQQLIETSGICVTEDDIVLVAGYNSKNVIMFDTDDSSLGELVSSKDMLSKPVSLCYDSTKCRLIVGSKDYKPQVYELS